MVQGKTNAYTYGLVEIVVHRPHIDDQERQKREAALKRVLATVGKEMLRRKGGCGNVHT